MNCSYCEKPVTDPVRTEETSGLCVTCIPVVALEYLILRKKNMHTEALLSQMRDLCETRKERLEHIHRLNDAERLGRAANNKGVGPDENPYLEDTEERIVWASGWEHENVLNEFSKNVAVYKWATESLEMISEICQEEETRAKIQTVIDKVSEVLAR